MDRGVKGAAAVRSYSRCRLLPVVCRSVYHLGTGPATQGPHALKKGEAEFKDMGMDYWLAKTHEVLARVQV